MAAEYMRFGSARKTEIPPIDRRKRLKNHNVVLQRHRPVGAWPGGCVSRSCQNRVADGLPARPDRAPDRVPPKAVGGIPVGTGDRDGPETANLTMPMC